MKINLASSSGVSSKVGPGVLAPPPVLLSVSGASFGQDAILHVGRIELASGRLVEALYFGNTNGTAGFSRINVRIHIGIAPGSAVSMRLTYLGSPRSEVTIGVK